MDKRSLLKGFLFKAILLYVIWQILYIGFIRNDTQLNQILTMAVVNGTSTGLKIFGFEASSESNIIYIDSEPAVRVEDVCNGLELFVLYIAFFLCFPGRNLPKTIYIVVGVLLLFWANILREIILAINYSYFRNSFDFNHKYTYTLIIYLLVFLLWKDWLKKYSIVSKTKKNQ